MLGFKGTLRFWLSVYIAATILVVGSLLTSAYLSFEWGERKADLESQAVRLARSVAIPSVDELIRDDSYALYKTVDTVISADNELSRPGPAEYIEVLDGYGRPAAVAKEGLNEGDEKIVQAHRKAASAASIPSIWKARLSDGSECIESDYPLFLEDGRIGTVRVGISDSAIRADMKGYVWKAVLLVFAAGLIGLLFAGKIANWVSRPINALVKGADEFRKGNMGHRVEVSTPGELAILASAFNDMASGLKEKMDGLDKARGEAEELTMKLSASYNDVRLTADRLQEANEWVTDMAFRIEEANQDLKAEKVQTDTIVHSIRDGLVAVDREDNIILVNPVAEEIFDVREEDVKGKPALVLADSLARKVDEPEAFIRKFMAATSTPETESAFTVTVVRPFKRVLRRLSSPIMDERGEVIGRVVTFRDITKEKEVDEMKTNFVSTVSHELRTPLTSIKGAINLLLDGQISDQETKHEFLKIAEQNADRLINLITNLLDLSRMESGRVRMKFAKLDMNAVAGAVVKSMEALARQQGVELEVLLSDDPAWIFGDKDKLEQTVTNLVGNAVKFSEPGCKVRLSTIVHDEDVRLAVEDAGVGIPKDKLERVFERFYQVDMSATRRTGGTGLGLAICKAIVKEHGGRIWAESPATLDGRGARFVLTLPHMGVQPPDADGPSKPALVQPDFFRGEKSENTILLVDDDASILEIHKQLFEQEGYRVLTATTGSEAIRVAREAMPGFIFLDVLLPDLDGFDVASILRSDEATKDIPIVFTTVLGEEGRERGMSLGRGYITKPFQQGQLITAVKELLK